MFSTSALVREMQPLKKFALKLTRNTWEAEDLLQATLLRALEKNRLFQADSDLFKWTARMMYCLFISHHRRRKFEIPWDEDIFSDILVMEPGQEQGLELAQVCRAIAVLSQEHQRILITICLDGTSYHEAAESLNLPVGTIRSRLSRARENLAAALTNTVSAAA